MELLKNKWVVGSFLGGIIVLTVLYFTLGPTGNISSITVPVKKGEFVISVISTGELEAKNSTKIVGPSGLQRAEIWQVELQDILPEGTVVEKGEYIARLDDSALAEKLTISYNEYEISRSEFTQTKLDTALDLRQAREEIINYQFAHQKQQLIVEQSQYEPPATIKQNQIELDKAQRTLDQARESYVLKYEKAVAKMQESYSKLSNRKSRYDFLMTLSQQLIIKAPEPGMLIYHKNWDGQKVVKGSMIRAWRPIVATLPDLSVMVSKTYVNEVDIRKIQKGQVVDVGLDAFPDKKLSGEVTSVSNVGEQKPNSDAKVFEVVIEIIDKDDALRPSMTTSNAILAEVIADARFVPLECIHSQGDTLIYVYKSTGLSYAKTQVQVGKSNENEVTILRGLEEGDQLYLSVPNDTDDSPVVLLDAEEVKIGLND